MQRHGVSAKGSIMMAKWIIRSLTTVLLVISIGWWIRSHRFDDCLCLAGPRTRTLDSVHGAVYFQSYPDSNTRYTFGWGHNDMEGPGFRPRGLTVEREGHPLLGFAAGTYASVAGLWWF